MKCPAPPLLSAIAGILTIAFTTTLSAERKPEPAAETPAQHDARMAWFRDARFGMFIHWGVYSVPAGEWENGTNYGEWIMESAKIPVSTYETFSDQFNPVKFDATEWVRMAKDAGMKYIVITSKHHDGFGLWNSELTDWDIGRTPFKRDPLKELADACEDAGIRFCFYHSIMDWHHPDWGTRRAWNDLASGEPDMDRYTDYMKGQLKELLTGYGPIGIVWFDGEWESPWTHERGVDLYRYCRDLQPNTIINNRVGKGRAGMGGMDKGQGVGDYGTPEQEIPSTGFGAGVDWESCMTMNSHWGYNKNDQNWKSTQTLIRNLIDCASKGGNYLLNIGPTSEGLFPKASIERLAEIGKWMKANGEAIYGTSASPFNRLSWGRCTTVPSRGETTLFLHVFSWPADGTLIVPGLNNTVQSARILTTGTLLAAVSTDKGVAVTVPTVAPDPISSTVVLKIKGEPDVHVMPITQGSDGSVRLMASEAELHGELKYETGGGKDNIGYWTNPRDWAEWRFKVTQPCRMQVSAEIAAEASARFTVSMGERTLVATAPQTGNYIKFEQVQLGVMELPAGQGVIQVRPVEEGWQPMNLKSVTLSPAQ